MGTFLTNSVGDLPKILCRLQGGKGSVEDPDPDPLVFGPPGSGSGSISQR